jgi:hypothetical protein
MAEIIRRAVEIQSGQVERSGREGISEDELRLAAAELGIEPGAITAALSSADSSEATARANLWGGPTRYESERVLNGILTEEQWEETVADLRRAFEEPGKVERRGETYEWSGTGGGLDFNTVTVRQSGNTVRVKSSSTGAGLGTIAYLLGFLPVFITVAVLSKAGLGPPFGVLALLAVGALTFLVARQATIAAGRRRRRLLRDVFDRLESRLESNDTDLRTNLAATGLRAVPGVETRSQSNSPGDPGAGVP